MPPSGSPAAFHLPGLITWAVSPCRSLNSFDLEVCLLTCHRACLPHSRRQRRGRPLPVAAANGEPGNKGGRCGRGQASVGRPEVRQGQAEEPCWPSQELALSVHHPSMKTSVRASAGFREVALELGLGFNQAGR